MSAQGPGRRFPKLAQLWRSTEQTVLWRAKGYFGFLVQANSTWSPHHGPLMHKAERFFGNLWGVSVSDSRLVKIRNKQINKIKTTTTKPQWSLALVSVGTLICFLGWSLCP